jgi:hypothetical protein
MAGRSLFFTILMLVIFLLLPGCTTVAIGDVRYEGNALEVPVVNSGGPVQVFLQVTAFEIRGLSQHEAAIKVAEVSLMPGQATCRVPLELGSGTYKLYLYVTADGDRKAGVIRDLVIP